jgi:hypothetical protein
MTPDEGVLNVHGFAWPPPQEALPGDERDLLSLVPSGGRRELLGVLPTITFCVVPRRAIQDSLTMACWSQPTIVWASKPIISISIPRGESLLSRLSRRSCRDNRGSLPRPVYPDHAGLTVGLSESVACNRVGVIEDGNEDESSDVSQWSRSASLLHGAPCQEDRAPFISAL